MKTICLIIHSLGIGGMERVMTQLANNFAQREKVEVHLILIGNKRRIEYSLSDSVVVHWPPFLFNNSRRRIDTIRTIKFLRQRVNELAPDTILSFGEMWNNLVLLALYGLNYPVYISDRSQPDKDLGTKHNFLRRVLYPRAAGFIAQTKEALRVCLSKGWNSNVQVIGNPVRTIQTNGQVEKENIVLSVGRLIKTKHFDQLIRMFAGIDNSNWKLVIVGGDAKKLELSKELDMLIKKLDVEESVLLEGKQKDIDRYYKKSKIFAFTSSSEGFPNVIGEALSAGLPVISYDCKAGPSDMIEDGSNGFLVDLFDQDAFKEQLKLLMENKHLRQKIGQNASETNDQRNPKLVANKFFSFITEKV